MKSIPLNRLDDMLDMLIKESVKKSVLNMADDLYEEVIYNSPVDTGRFRNNVRFDLNEEQFLERDAPDAAPARYSPPNSMEVDNSGKLSIESRFELGDTIILSNNLGYTDNIEFSGWESKGKHKPPYKPFTRGAARVFGNLDNYFGK